MEKQRKACSKCGIEKDEDEFSKVRSNSLLRRQPCKACQLVRDNAWRARNPEKTAASARKYAKTHPGKRQAFQKLYRELHPERVKETRAKWVAKNREAICARRALARDAIKRTVIAAYSNETGACCLCGAYDLDILCVDHINNDGHIHRKAGLLGGGLYAWIIKNAFPPGFQILCANCNLKKSIMYMRSLVGKDKSDTKNSC